MWSSGPLAELNFRWYFLARTVNMIGGTMASVALAFAVLEISDSPAALGQVLAANSIPMVVFLLIGGVIADRFNRATLMRVCNLLAGLSQGASAILVLTGRAELWHLVALSALNGTVFAVSLPAMSSVLPQLVPREHLQQANVLVSMMRGALTILGPSTAGVIVVAFSPGWALAVDAASWLLSAAILLGVRIPSRLRGSSPTSTLADLKAGWSLFIGHTWLWVVVLAFGALNAIHAGAWSTLGPALAKDTIGERGWGLALSAEAAGLLLMTVILLKARFQRPLLAGMLGCSLFSLPLVALGLDPSLVVILVAAFIAGMGMEIFGIGWNLAMQENIDESMLSRAYSYDMLGSFVAIPVGQLLFGPLGERWGVQDVILWAGVAYAAICLLTLTSASVRRLSRGEVSTTSAPAS
ncbi:MFS family permease [Nocardioides daedukensis]|uniref:MFS family permease n=1 Tax=Nocardioides daedukensis TaxID=634462 RepID=A0A7Y9UVQ1_9ACTN|nr:MFS transporter [Nocardioides daedukensis]NYG58365.1 MFS family permease [Nocardioides daedukensis]